MKDNSPKIVYIFIDASNVWESQKAKGRFFDYEKLRDYLKEKYTTGEVKVFYYTAYPADGTRNYNLDGKHKFFTYLKKGLGFIVRKKKLKRICIASGQGEHIKEKGDMDVEITIDAIHHSEKYSMAVFFTGDSDFLALVSYLRSKGKDVFVYSSKNNISEELRTGADCYTDLLRIKDDIWGRKLKHREEKEE